jgi:MOSC domain-containing protein YiiM
MARVAQLSVSSGGVPKLAVERAWLGPLGLEGDAHRLASHGGPERAVCLYSVEVIQALQAEGHPIYPGAAGENVTISGLDWATLKPGDRIRVGESVIELTRHTTPCKNVRPYFAGGDIVRILHDQHPGWSRFYGKVLIAAPIAVGEVPASAT